MFLYGWVETRALTPQAWRPWLWLWLGRDATCITESICEPFVLEQIVPYTKIQQPNQQEPIMEEPSIQEFLRKQNVKQTIGFEGIPEMDERMAREMWETVHQKAIEE